MELDRADLDLIDQARRTARALRRPGVNEVAAALRTTSGRVFTGIHIEASVGYASVCGEVAAICAMVGAGEQEVDTIVAVAPAPGDTHVILSRCGRCRDLIADSNPNAFVVLGPLAAPKKVSIAELMPSRARDERIPRPSVQS